MFIHSRLARQEIYVDIYLIEDAASATHLSSSRWLSEEVMAAGGTRHTADAEPPEKKKNPRQLYHIEAPTICVVRLFPFVLFNCEGWTLASGGHPGSSKSCVLMLHFISGGDGDDDDRLDRQTRQLLLLLQLPGVRWCQLHFTQNRFD